MDNHSFIDEARIIAHHCLATTDDPVESVAMAISAWMDTAALYARNESFYRDLLDRCADHLGDDVFVADDGSIMEDPIRLKIPILVEQLGARRNKK